MISKDIFPGKMSTPTPQPKETPIVLKVQRVIQTRDGAWKILSIHPPMRRVYGNSTLPSARINHYVRRRS